MIHRYPPGWPVRAWDQDDAARDYAYLPGASVRDYRDYLRTYEERSAAARATLPWHAYSYGPDPAEVLHFFPGSRPGSPLHVFVHGGYWQELSEAESSFAALDLIPRGAAFAALGYGLAPRHTLTEIVGMVRRGVLWLYQNAETLGFSPDGMFLSGHSAGAHLVAMCLMDGWLPAPIHPVDVVRGAMLLSGLYELTPLCGTSIGEAIGLSLTEAVELSPVRYLPDRLPPLVVARGGDESAAFADQQDYLTGQVRRQGAQADDLVVPGRHHFDLLLGLGDPGDPLGHAQLTQMGLLPTADLA